jgi:TolB protein
VTRSEGTDGRFGEEHGPTWSRDGKRLVYVSNRDGQWELYSIGAGGAGERRLTTTPEYDEDAPRYTSDGTRIVFSRSGRIAVVNPDGTGVRELGPGVSADQR